MTKEEKIVVTSISGLGAIATAAFLWTTSLSASAQQTTGEPGSPTATTTLSGKQLPPPDPQFGGVIKEKASESKPWWAPRVVPPSRRSSRRSVSPPRSSVVERTEHTGLMPRPSYWHLRERKMPSRFAAFRVCE